ncbi:hypothetical protein QE152_g9082 [Popillia japonica]|uniref:Nuclease HARBI1 n=1 Tax=Popillia japonica TaxID=7064 RepID=A0AAW1M026_POPJA
MGVVNVENALPTRRTYRSLKCRKAGTLVFITYSPILSKSFYGNKSDVYEIRDIPSDSENSLLLDEDEIPGSQDDFVENHQQDLEHSSSEDELPLSNFVAPSTLFYILKKNIVVQDMERFMDSEDEEMLELVDLIDRQRRRKVFRPRENQFEKWNDLDFIRRFRFSKDGVRFILENITDEILHPTERNKAVTAETMLFVTLRFYATGFLQVVGDFVGIDKATACRIVHKVSRAIASLHTTSETTLHRTRNISEQKNFFL